MQGHLFNEHTKQNKSFLDNGDIEFRETQHLLKSIKTWSAYLALCCLKCFITNKILNWLLSVFLEQKDRIDLRYEWLKMRLIKSESAEFEIKKFNIEY